MRMEWSDDDLMALWTLVGEDWSLVGNKTGATRLGFAVLKFFEIEARFPRSAEEVPPAAVAYLAEQLKLDPELFTGCDWTGRTVKYHREQVRAAFGSASSLAAMRTSSPDGWPRRSARSSCGTSSRARRCWCAAAPSESDHRADSTASSARRGRRSRNDSAS
jgi:Domain of unknown function (DUF4158)